MSQAVAIATKQAESEAKTLFGFWVYLMTDCVLFASLFATYAVLHNNTFGGEPASVLFSLPFVLVETLLLLTSSYTCGLAMLAVRRLDKPKVIYWMAITAALGLAFLGLEVSEFHKLVVEGNSWRESGFLSSYFTLVATHGLHITVGLLWISVVMFRTFKRGLTSSNVQRLKLISLFWHFLDIIWIFIFTIVYLFGAVSV